MDRVLRTAADTVLSATMNLGGASIAVDNEMMIILKQPTKQVSRKYGTMSHGQVGDLMEI